MAEPPSSNSHSPLLDDYRWLVGAAAAPWLQRCTELAAPDAAQVARLRRELSAAQTHLVLEQVELRRRAEEKFAAAGRLFFTRQQLEQATDDALAAYKAKRFAGAGSVADLCCGIGGDLMALGQHARDRGGRVYGIERDPIVAVLAAANCAALGLSPTDLGDSQVAAHVETREADVDCLAAAQAWHIDPDRRVHGRRGVSPTQHSPPLDVLREMLAALPHAAIKLAPAAELPADWHSQAELEWLSRRGECRQLVAWFGDLTDAAGRRRATIISDSGPVRTLVADEGGGIQLPAPSAQVGRYIYEPDSAVIAAGLVPVLAEELRLAPLDPRIAYLTGDELRTDPAVAAFEVLESLPFHLKRLKALLRARGIGRLEIKKRGVPYAPEEIARALRVAGDETATLLLTRQGDKPLAILARRVRPG